MPYLFLFYCFIELWLMLTIGAEIGAITTILWFIVSAVIGVNLLRLIGFQQVNKHFNQHFSQGQKNIGDMGSDDSVSTIIIKALGAIGLIIPGFLSDVVGVLLFSPLRILIFMAVSNYWQKNVASKYYTQTNKQTHHQADSTGRTIEGEYTDAEYSHDENKRN